LIASNYYHVIALDLEIKHSVFIGVSEMPDNCGDFALVVLTFRL